MNKKQMKSQSKVKSTKPPVVKVNRPKASDHVHEWKVFINHMTEAPEGQRCACGAQEWF